MDSRIPFLLGKGWVHSRDLIYLYGATREANSNDEYESVVVRWDNGEWGLWQVATRLCSVFTGEPHGERVVFCVGIDGYVEVSDEHGVHVETIDPSPTGPDRLKHITFAKPIGNHVLAVGMSRMVYSRAMESSEWLRIDDGARVASGSAEIAGFKSIDGDGLGRYIAVGFYGDLWLYDERRWRRLTSPTNAKLECVRWVSESRAYIAGGGGILLRGQPDALEIVEQSSTKQTFWSMEWYDDHLYLATRDGSLWRLHDDDIVPVQLSSERAVTTGWLHANDGVLLSVGEHDLLVFDGHAWRSIDQPPLGADWPFEW